MSTGAQRRKRATLIESTLLVAVAAGFIWLSRSFGDGLTAGAMAIQPTTVPRIALTVLILAALTQAVLACWKPAPDGEDEPLWNVSQLMSMLVCGMYVVLAYWFGFFVPMPFFCVALAALWGARALPRLLAYAVGCTALNWLVFIVAFESDLPLGPLGR